MDGFSVGLLAGLVATLIVGGLLIAAVEILSRYIGE
jgi:hypothetical protein